MFVANFMNIIDAMAGGISRRAAMTRACLLGLALASLGCQSSTTGPSTAAVPIKSKVIAQGQILPAAGIVQLSTTPGDVVEEVLVQVGDTVQAGDLLMKMRSEQVRVAQLATLRKRQEEAVRERDNGIASAKQQLQAVQMKLDHLSAQQAALKRRSDLLALAQQQVDASRDVLNRLESISSNAATSEFVGQLEIARQRIAVGEAELNYRQQAEALKQAEEDLNWARKATLEEHAAAQMVLSAAEDSQALEVLDLEIKALEKQAEAARLVAPADGVVLAINAAPGEASIQLPLIELADISRLVCEVEINEMDAALVQEGQSATIRSRALGPTELHGTVTQKFKLVGRPQLRALDPLARSDFRTVTAVIELAPESVQVAQDWLQLQVEVEIDRAPQEAAESEPSSAASTS